MRIAQVSPLFESVPPKMYGGTERIVSYITECLVSRGHEVTLFASGDSRTAAKLVDVTKKSLRLYNQNLDFLLYHTLQLAEVAKRANDFDIIHFHTDYLHFPMSMFGNYTHVTTLHGRLDLIGLDRIYREFNEMPIVSVSDSQRIPVKDANWIKTVHHGLPKNLYRPNFNKGTYLAFIGRISSEKRVDRAIEIAIKCNLPLIIAAKIDPADVDYFETNIRHLLDHPLIKYIGEIDDSLKNEFLGNAIAMLFPIDWPEPFGLVQIEAMACGTPVIAFNCGAVSEIINNGVNGYMVNTIEEAISAVQQINRIDRNTCREYFDKYFTADRMVENYLEIYQSLIAFRTGSQLINFQNYE